MWLFDRIKSWWDGFKSGIAERKQKQAVREAKLAPIRCEAREAAQKAYWEQKRKEMIKDARRKARLQAKAEHRAKPVHTIRRGFVEESITLPKPDSYFKGTKWDLKIMKEED